MSDRHKMAAGLLKLSFGQFEAPLGSPVFGDDRRKQPELLGAKPEHKRKDPPARPALNPEPAKMDPPAAPPADPKSPLDHMTGPMKQELHQPLPYLGEIGKYFRSLFTKEQQ